MPFEGVIFAAVIGGVIMITTIGTKLLSTISQHLERKARLQSGGADLEALRAEIDRLQAELPSAQELQQRLAEMEERLDFTERLLLQQRDREQLKP